MSTTLVNSEIHTNIPLIFGRGLQTLANNTVRVQCKTMSVWFARLADILRF